ncbi:zinc finger protein 341 [Nephila pilipes]|uniref:Zinc finger protein 341 n=1 Tax=Nephila pilipes TaxID=299642 RepID=A0A8X6TJC0_NEPPI|nr:zinc finger protein 341 [Nephila pilipes]
MAQLMFEAIPAANVSGVPLSDKQTVLTVRSMLDSQLIAQPETGSTLEDSDVFQCGKCKKQFLSIEVFVNHKAECNNSAVSPVTDITLPSNVCGVPQNTVLVQKIQIPSSTLTNYPQSLVLTEADLLQLSAAGLDPSAVTTAVTSNSNINVVPSHAVMPQTTYTSQALPATVQHVLQQVASQDPQHSQTVELSIINDKFISRPIFLTSQQANSAISGVVLNISNTAEPASVLCSNPETDKNANVVVETPHCETLDSGNNNDQNGNDKEPSTVNIITEFHSSMVKSKKPPPETENDDSQNKKDNKLSCAYCFKFFTKNFDLQQHIRCHTGEKPFQCIVCGRAFAQKSNVKKHMQTHKVWPDGLAKTLPHLLGKNSSSCSDGEISQDNNVPDAPDHTMNLEPDKNGSDIDKSSYACPYCSYIGNSYYKLKSHMKKHDTEKVYKCILSSCGQMFNDLDPFLEHTKSHENEMTYRCHECNKNFPSLYELGSHQFSHSLYPNSRPRTSRRFFQCNLCLNKYSTPAALDHHLATSSHTYSCSWCDKVFPCERYLRRHLQIHSESEAFTCNICNKGFKTESYLKVHMLVHSEEKPYDCSICKAAFNRKDKLKRHLLIHEPVKRYKCPFRTHGGCPKEFNRADKLKSHILTHSCIKPFTCGICGKNFTRKAHLRDHEKQNHNEDDLKQLAEEEEPLTVKCNISISPLTDSNDSKSSKNNKLMLSKRSYRNRKQRKKLTYLNNFKNNCDQKKKTRSKKNLCLNFEEIDTNHDIDSNSEMADDIPTSHIEIISTYGIVPNSELTQISLPPEMTYSDLHFDPTEEETNIPDASPISVETIHSNNSNSLLSTDLQSTADIADYS